MEIHEGIQALDSTIFDKVFDYYDVAKEFMNILHNSKASNEIVNELLIVLNLNVVMYGLKE